MPSPQKLVEFVAWVKQHLTGDEKGEAQLFLERLFQALGHAGLKEAGATLEFRMAKSAEVGGSTAFADPVWKPVVLIEMKKRGADLQNCGGRSGTVPLAPALPAALTSSELVLLQMTSLPSSESTSMKTSPTISLALGFGQIWR